LKISPAGNVDLQLNWCLG